MAVSNPATLSSVIATFGGPANMNAYYKGGSYVTAANSSANSISTTAAGLRLSQFAGVSKVTSLPATTLSTYSVYGSCTGAVSCTAYSAYVTATCSGATSFAWSRVSGDLLTVSAATSATTRFSKGGPTNSSYAAVYRCTASASGYTSTYADVSIALDAIYIDPCPAPWVPVLMADMTWREAGNLRVGDMVWARPAEGENYGAYPVVAANRSANIRWRLATQDGREIVCSYGHRLSSRGAWVDIQDFKAGDVIDGTEQGIVAEVSEADDGEVVQITVGGAHTFVLAGLLSHNIK